MAKKKPQTPSRIVNRRARYDYELGDSLVVGIQLSGGETKALRMGHGQLRGAYVNVRNDELWLVGAQISSSSGVPLSEDQQNRSRKLLAKRREIDRLIAARGEGNTIVPLELLTNGRYIKLRIAVGRGKRRYDKRETLKRRQQEREAKRTTG
ncbi:MAG TPA: SsrA-binding protein SmpB [Candidatus Saccharimonadales bacterium]|nr:SsrA-binding protein SmpB [Candidatus Saccharimonadales bacterium]